MYSEYFFTICKNFIYHYTKKYWKESNNHYKVFQNQLLTFHKLSDEGREYLLKKFYKYIKRNYNIDSEEFNQLYKNFFIEHISDVFQSGISKKEFAEFKLKNPNFASKIKFNLPKVSSFVYVMFRDSAKFFYNNAKFIVKPRAVIFNHINENLKITIYHFVPLNDILSLQNKVQNKQNQEDTNSVESDSSDKLSDKEKDTHENSDNSLEYLSEKTVDDITFENKLKSIYA